ncbi:hypothetical protein WSM22_44840 [Cytophagales bacterium WSM2-2]|nr:hypothetical protein WSM22_44840 [Cytophagales bacterium WSM2-2]
MQMKSDQTTDSLEKSIQGVWWLLSREDYNENNVRRIDPVLGAEPIGILAYGKQHFTAQFMKRDRKSTDHSVATPAGMNNTSAMAGYDAYFGTYQVDHQTGMVSHTLIGSVIPANVGMTVLRNLAVADGKLIIKLSTTTTEGEAVTRTLTWERVN